MIFYVTSAIIVAFCGLGIIRFLPCWEGIVFSAVLAVCYVISVICQRSKNASRR